jgi:hypothetical protein
MRRGRKLGIRFMNTKQRWASWAGAALGTVCALSALTMARADELAEKGKAIFNANQRAVITVQLVLKNKISMPGVPGQSSETRQDATGTVVDASGLTVLSLSATDPSLLLANMMAGGDEETKFKMESELSDVKLLLEDGTELPAEVVLRDKDLDLAFVRPKTKPATAFAAVDLSKAGKAEVLEQVIALNRLGYAVGRAYAASAERISAIVTRPRLFYVPETSVTTTALGAPAFTLDGKLLGLFVMRSTKSRGGGGGGMFNPQAGNFAGIIVPADDVAKAMKQVPPPAGEKH